ncbi:MAG: hypothetical protein AB1627_17155 [Chloroflexota bacterium]
MRIRQPAGIGRTLDRLALVGVLSLALAACGGSASGATTTNAPTADASAAPAEPTTAPQPTAGMTVQVDGEAWFAGFHLTFGAATAEVTPGRGGVVAIETVFENTGDEDARLDATLNLASAGENAREAMAMDIPSVPGGLTAKGVLAFDVEDTFTFDDAVLTLGRSGNQQAIVPLTAMAGEAMTREPVAVTASGSGLAGDLRIDLDAGELRADSPWKHGQMEDGSLVLTMSYSATFDSGFAGGFAFTAENVALRLPDGTTVGVIQDGRSQSIELIGPNATVKDLYSRFEIDDPAAGEYAFLVRSFDGAEDEIAFTID